MTKLIRLFPTYMLKNYLGTYQATSNIPGMPAAPALSTDLHEVTAIPTGPIGVMGLQKDQNPVYSAATINVPQPHVVTTPISLPGMPPITVSASLPQNTSFYTPVLQQHQMPLLQQHQLAPDVNATATIAEVITTAPPTLTSTSTQ